MGKAHNIVIGQNISEGKRQRARELRGAMTAAEKKLWEHVRANKLSGFHFRRQQIIDGFIVDFYCHKAQLVIEIDGSSHEDKQEYDASRDEVLCGRGLRIMRFSNEQVYSDLKSVLKEISQYLLSSPFAETSPPNPLSETERGDQIPPSLSGKGVRGLGFCNEGQQDMVKLRQGESEE